MFEYTLFRICPLDVGSLKLGLPPSGLPPAPSMSPARPQYSLLLQDCVQLMSACMHTLHKFACQAAFCITQTLHASIAISMAAAACRSISPQAMSRPEGLGLLLITSRSDSSWRWGRGGGQRLLLHAAPGLKLLPVPPGYQRVAVLLRVCRRCACSGDKSSAQLALPTKISSKLQGAHSAQPTAPTFSHPLACHSDSHLKLFSLEQLISLPEAWRKRDLLVASFISMSSSWSSQSSRSAPTSPSLAPSNSSLSSLLPLAFLGPCKRPSPALIPLASEDTTATASCLSGSPLLA